MVKLPELRIGELVAPVPIVQGGMGVGISMSRLAAAVANEGGIGVLSAAMPGFMERDVKSNMKEANIRGLRLEIRKAREATRGVLGVNIMVALTDYADMVNVSVEEGIDIIFSGAGMPLSLPEYLPEGSKTKLSPIVSSGRAAMLICKKWLKRYNVLPDAVVVEGPKAGGHLGFKNDEIDDPAHALEVLVPQVKAALNPFEEEYGKRIPVIAAGGVYTGRDMFDTMALGADAVQLGTRFVATHECDAEMGFKQTYIDAKQDDIVVIKSPVGMPGRAIRNPFLDAARNGERTPMKCPFHCIRTCDPEKSPYCIATALANARRGKFTYGFAFAGANAWRVDKIVPVKDLMSELSAGYLAAAAAGAREKGAV
ncbi:MAG: nitronate monooxygenase [Pseudomonadota bacterium]